MQKIQIISFMAMVGFAPFRVGETFDAPKEIAKKLINMGVAKKAENTKK